MLDRALPALTLALATPALVSASPAEDMAGVQWAQLTIRERVVIRIPRMDARAPISRQVFRAPAAPVVWSETKAPKCVASASLVGASFNGGDVDMVTSDGRRLRAKLDDDCPALDFYTGFYLKRTADGQICAKRDSLRSRSGASCEITRFRTLVAQR